MVYDYATLILHNSQQYTRDDEETKFSMTKAKHIDNEIWAAYIDSLALLLHYLCLNPVDLSNFNIASFIDVFCKVSLIEMDNKFLTEL